MPSTNQPAYHKKPWKPNEDELLRKAVKKHGCPEPSSERHTQQQKNLSWSSVAAMVPGRVAKQCRERWRNHLRPQLNKGEWSTQEDVDIWDHVQTMGTKWAQV